MADVIFFLTAAFLLFAMNAQDVTPFIFILWMMIDMIKEG